MKKFLLFLTILSAVLSGLSVSRPASAQTDGPAGIPYTEREVPVIRNVGMETGNVTLRFYETMPSVAYISAADYLAMWIPGAEMKTEQTGPGIYELTSPTGKATVDTEKDTFYSEDFSAFTNLMGLVQEGMANTYYDGMPFVKFVSIESDPETVPVTFDFSSYSIELFGDNSAVYFPFAVISDMYSDLFYHHAGFNGEEVVMNYSNFDMLLSEIDPSYPQGLVSAERPEDLAAFTYNELCFALDHFYGRPGREPISASLAEKGLDRALDDFGNTGAMIKKHLKSTVTAEYYLGMYGLSGLFNDGGHTTMDHPGLNNVTSADQSIIGPVMEQYDALFSMMQRTYAPVKEINSNSREYADRYRALLQLQTKSYGPGETYIKKGDTAVCVFRSFDSRNQEAWDAYYSGTGPMPTLANTDGDAMVIFLDALYRAEADPEVRNFVLDISINSGGSADLVMAIASLITGSSTLQYENALTGQKTTVTYAADRNFDGVFDEKDADVHFALNFAVLTSRVSFSCANLFPSIMHDAGYPILGEASGGGACAVMFLNTADGYDYLVSSWRARLINDEGENIDSGIPVDADLSDQENLSTVPTGNGSVTVEEYSKFYDPELLGRLVSEAYSMPEAEPVSGEKTGSSQ